MAKYRELEIGDPAPWFTQSSTSNANYHFDTVGGRYIVLCFFGTSVDEQGRNMLSILTTQRKLFDDDHIAFFGVSVDPSDAEENRVKESLPGIRYFWDFDGRVSQLYGTVPLEKPNQPVTYKRLWFILNPNFRIRAIFPAQIDGSDCDQVSEYLQSLPAVNEYCGLPVQAPIIILPDVFETQFCRHLIELYEVHGGEESGFMRESEGKTVRVFDYGHKRRSDYTIENDALKIEIQQRVIRRVSPEIQKVHQFTPTRMERYIVACYDAVSGGHFRPHRDDTTKGTAHREFALSINLNDDFDGGEVGFPEYGTRTFKAPAGGAVVFSCSLLHMVTPVTRGRRYVFLPFLYNEQSAALREANNRFLGQEVGKYHKDNN